MPDSREQILVLWDQLAAEQRGQLVAELLCKTDGWHEFAGSKECLLGWLALQFRRAQLHAPQCLVEPSSALRTHRVNPTSSSP